MARQANIPIRAMVVIATVILAVLLLASAVQATSDASDSVPAITSEHQVRSGDNLWSIAEQYTPHGDDVRGTVDNIRSLNRLDSSTIYAGQVLIVPGA